ncbi:SdpI family protein [Candidatus Bathyarchaeota archaeon]|nr:SdpI family protein [Candidatus Bathyarchaeota archaeon]MBS7627706.1 SdpI family protein [Candidatus Bathyarchaeota archaeon]
MVHRIRTPWTLSNEKVWKKTHKLGGRLFKIVGIITFFAIFSSDFYSINAIIYNFCYFYTIAYSYFEYKKEERK